MDGGYFIALRGLRSLGDRLLGGLGQGNFLVLFRPFRLFGDRLRSFLYGGSYLYRSAFKGAYSAFQRGNIGRKGGITQLYNRHFHLATAVAVLHTGICRLQ